MNNSSENTRVQVSAALHLCKLDYNYLDDITQFNGKTNILTDAFLSAIKRINPSLTKAECKSVLAKVLTAAAGDDLGQEFYEMLSFELTKTCEELSQNIISEMCQQVMKKMDEAEGIRSLLWCADDYPDYFTFSDILSMQHQSMDYEEICPLLPDFIEQSLESAYYDLPICEQTILSFAYNDDGYTQDLEKDVSDAFVRAENERYETDKIQEYLDRPDEDEEELN